MNKPMAVWGLVLFIGFVATHFLVFSMQAIYTLPLWVLLLVIGHFYSMGGCCKNKKKCKCSLDLWSLGIVECVILTVAIIIQLIQISSFYIMSIWMLCLGSTLVADSMRTNKAVARQIGFFWLFCAVFFPFVTN
jgi:hypothetical protein